MHALSGVARHEAWYASLLHMCLRAIGVEVRSDEATGHGPVDMVVEPDDEVFVIAFKRAGRAEEAEAAFTQKRDRRHGDRCRHSGRKVPLIAVACRRKARNPLDVPAEPE